MMMMMMMMVYKINEYYLRNALLATLSTFGAQMQDGGTFVTHLQVRLN